MFLLFISLCVCVPCVMCVCAEEYEFYPSESFFPRGLVSIPKHLLEDIVKCYGERREYCKVCSMCTLCMCTVSR